MLCLLGTFQVKLMEQKVPYSYIKLEKEVSELAEHARVNKTIPVLSDTEFRYVYLLISLLGENVNTIGYF